MNWQTLQELFQRSHTYLLLEDLIKVFNKPADKKLDFKVLAEVQEAFDHLAEVFEQDLRIGEQNEVVEYCKDKQEQILKAALYHMCKEQNIKDTIIHKALLLKEDDLIQES